jgi:hypothetical protein
MKLLLLDTNDKNSAWLEELFKGRETCDVGTAVGLSYEAVVVINDGSEKVFEQLSLASQIAAAKPSIPVAIVTPLDPAWTPEEALLHTAPCHRDERDGQLAKATIGAHWPRWNVNISDEAMSFEYQD